MHIEPDVVDGAKLAPSVDGRRWWRQSRVVEGDGAICVVEKFCDLNPFTS